MNDLIEKLKIISKRPDVVDIHSKVLFLSVPRSGSTYLCDVVSQLGLIGQPEEWLNPAYIVELPPQIIDVKNTDSIFQFFDFIMKKSASPNGIFSLNLHLSSYEWWLRNGWNWIELIDFDLIYFIYRKDKYAQAYSYAIAHSKNEWRRTKQIVEVENVDDIQFHNILQFLTTILNLEHSYEQNLQQLVRREFAYEDFSSNIEETIHSIGKDLQVDISNIPKSNLQIQRKGYTQEQLVQFRAFMQTKLKDL